MKHPVAIDNIGFTAVASRILVAPKRLSGPYEACIAVYGSEDHAEKVVVSIVDAKRRIIVDHKAWLTSEYGDEISSSVEVAIDVLTAEMIEYCERSRVRKVLVIDKPLQLKELEKCPRCGGDQVRVPWQDA